MADYPVVHFLVRFGGLFAIGLALSIAAAGMSLALVGGVWLYAPAGIGIGVVVYVLIKSYTEVVAIVSDILLPK